MRKGAYYGVVMEPAQDRYMPMGEVLAFLGVSRSTLAKYVRDGRLTPVQLPGGQRRYSAVAVAALIGVPPDALLGHKRTDTIPSSGGDQR
jgi:predicted DNA-binding transcriptional regulator AlpA